MEETSARLRQVFAALAAVRGVYFFAELDALGSQRTTPNEAGEAGHLLNGFLQMIEQDQSTSLIVCATQHEEILDHALFRRFDDVVRYRLPSVSEIVALFKDRLTAYVSGDFSWDRLAELADGLSGAAVTLVAQDAVKEMLIKDQYAITLAQLEAGIADAQWRRRTC